MDDERGILRRPSPSCNATLEAAQWIGRPRTPEDRAGSACDYRTSFRGTALLAVEQWDNTLGVRPVRKLTP